MYSKTCVKQPLSKRQKIGFQDQLSLDAGQKYCRMLQREHSAILMTFIEPPFDIQSFVLSIFEWPFYTGFTVQVMRKHTNMVTYNFQSKKRVQTNPGRKKRRKKKSERRTKNTRSGRRNKRKRQAETRRTGN